MPGPNRYTRNLQAWNTCRPGHVDKLSINFKEDAYATKTFKARNRESEVIRIREPNTPMVVETSRERWVVWCVKEVLPMRVADPRGGQVLPHLYGGI